MADTASIIGKSFIWAKNGREFTVRAEVGRSVYFNEVGGSGQLGMSSDTLFQLLRNQTMKVKGA